MPNPAAWLIGLALLLPAALVVPASADEHHRLFGCRPEQSTMDFMALYAIEQADGTWRELHFVIERGGIIKASVLEHGDAEPRLFYFSNSEGPEGYLAEVRFSGGEQEFVLAMLDIPPDPAEESDMGGRATALTITERDGSSRNLSCGEVDEYIGLMQEAMACDMTNPYGVAGCDFGNRPQRMADDPLPLSLQ